MDGTATMDGTDPMNWNHDCSISFEDVTGKQRRISRKKGCREFDESG
jgi:hypothetical protein